jgi:three-Cys-motif partner protein
VRKRGNKIAYVDLFAGPGRYSDGSKSTPLLVLEKAISDPVMRKMLVTVFNDKDPEFTSALAHAIRTLPDIEELEYPPQVHCQEIGSKVVEMFEQMELIPTLMFVDPWGYKGLSLRLIQSVLKDWGCDCIFFFNYNRINMGLSNPLVQEHMKALFGLERANSLSKELERLSAADRELTIVEELVEALKQYGGEYVLPFRFRNERGTRTSHHLIFVSKNFTAYHIMKEIMARESSSTHLGVPSFEYSLADWRFPQLFALNKPLEELVPDLIEIFSGQNITVGSIYQLHSVGKPFIKKNYKDVLRQLEAEGRIVADPPSQKRRKGTIGDGVRITFQAKET